MLMSHTGFTLRPAGEMEYMSMRLYLRCFSASVFLRLNVPDPFGYEMKRPETVRFRTQERCPQSAYCLSLKPHKLHRKGRNRNKPY